MDNDITSPMFDMQTFSKVSTCTNFFWNKSNLEDTLFSKYVFSSVKYKKCENKCAENIDYPKVIGDIGIDVY